MTGKGVEASVEGRQVLIGNRALMTEHGVALDTLSDETEQAAAAGETPMFVAFDGEVAGFIAVADTLKPESTSAVAELKALGLEVWMLTGDHRATAEAIAAKAGIEHVLAEVLPDQKSAKIQELQASGKVVAMVGDGINDAPALAQAELGIAIGTGTDVAMAASDITLIGGDLRTIVTAIDLSRRTVSTIKQGLAWAFGYNIILVPVAMGALYPFFGVQLSPILAAAAMAMSSVSVVTNALRLRGFRPPKSAVEILHPPLVRRVREIGYLAAIALLALGIGAAALILVPDAGAGASMNSGVSPGAGLHAAALTSADRTVDITASDALSFDPSSLSVRAGETVAFRITNTGKIDHEFVIGDAAFQAEHDKEMQSGGMSSMSGSEVAYEISLAPGETRIVTYRFDDPGQFLYGCHVPGHYAAGMKGVITVTR